MTFAQAASVPTSGCVALSNLPPASEVREGGGGDALVNGAGGGVGAFREAFRHLVEDELRGKVVLVPG